MKNILAKTDGTIIPIQPKDLKKGFQLEELYELIGCEMIEMVHSKDGRYIIIDEEGKLKDSLLINSYATKLYINSEYDIIVGNAVICEHKYFK